MSTPFPYAARARDVQDAHRALHASFRDVKSRSNPRDPGTVRWLAAIERFEKALHKAYPEHFWTHLDDLRAGNTRYVETALSFLEADPIFFRSGYIKVDVLRALKRLPMTQNDQTRLRTIVLDRIKSRGGREFRHYCHLARSIDGAGFRTSVETLAASSNPAIARRARWALEAMDQGRQA